MTIGSRDLGRLTSYEVSEVVSKDSILCIPFGSFEQHGRHLPIETDAVLADRICTAVVEKFGEEFDLWRLPTIPFGYSPEHAGAAGCIGLDFDLCVRLLRGVCEAVARATRARRLLIVNGHGGNKPLLMALVYDIERVANLKVAVTHPSALSGIESGSPTPEVHGGKSETSIMLALVPEHVRLDLISEQDGTTPEQHSEVNHQILDGGATWAWSSSDPALSTIGVVGQPHLADRELGQRIVDAAVDGHRRVLEQLRSAA